MIIHFNKLAGDKLANLLCEINAMVEDGTIPMGILGLSPDSAEFSRLIYNALGEEKEVWFTDKGLGLK